MSNFHSNTQEYINDEKLLIKGGQQARLNNFTAANGSEEITQIRQIPNIHHQKRMEDHAAGPLPSYIISQMRKDLILSDDILHIIHIIKMVRDALKRSCAESKRSRKEAFKLFFQHHDLFSIATPLLFSDSNEAASGS